MVLQGQRHACELVTKQGSQFLRERHWGPGGLHIPHMQTPVCIDPMADTHVRVA